MHVQTLIIFAAAASAMINTGRSASSWTPPRKASDVSIQGDDESAGLVFPPPSEFMLVIDESGSSQSSMSDLIEMLRKQRSQSPWDDLFKKIRHPPKPRYGDSDDEEQEHQRRRAVAFLSRKSGPSKGSPGPSSGGSRSEESPSPSKNAKASLAYLRSASTPSGPPSASYAPARFAKSASASPNLEKLRKHLSDALTGEDGSRRVGVEVALSFAAGLAFACFVLGIFALVRTVFLGDDKDRKDLERGGYGALPSEEDELMYFSPSRRMHKKFRPKL